MTLLLAFFIIMQAFAESQDEGLFYAGQGSFIRAIETFGLGGVWPTMRTGLPGTAIGPRYTTAEGTKSVHRLRRIDPELENAQQALQTLRDQFYTRTPTDAEPWTVIFTTQASYGAGRLTLAPEDEEMLAEFARRLKGAVRTLLGQWCMVRIGAVIYCTEEEEPEHARAALDAVREVKTRLLDAMPPSLRRKASPRFYTFCRRSPPESRPDKLVAGQLAVAVMLTKYVSRTNENRSTGR
jgi:hypothetical protein